MSAYLQSATLGYAHLGEANLVGIHLREAILMGAHLEGALLLGVNLAEANLFGCTRLTQEGLDNAIGDENTQLPAGLIRPAAWSESIDDQLERLKSLHPPSGLRKRMVQSIEKEMVRRTMHRNIEETFRGL